MDGLRDIKVPLHQWNKEQKSLHWGWNWKMGYGSIWVPV